MRVAGSEDRFGGFADTGEVVVQQDFEEHEIDQVPEPQVLRPDGCSVTAWSFCATW